MHEVDDFILPVSKKLVIRTSPIETLSERSHGRNHPQKSLETAAITTHSTNKRQIDSPKSNHLPVIQDDSTIPVKVEADIADSP